MSFPLRSIAEDILMSQVNDIEFLTVWEIMDDKLKGHPAYDALSNEQQHELALQLDKLILSAIVTIEIPEDADATS